MEPDARLQDFLQPLRVDSDVVHRLSEGLLAAFRTLAAEDKHQFLPTPISESILRPVSKTGHGRHLAIDIGGTNLRVGFIELSGKDVANGTSNGNGDSTSSSSPKVARLKERSWPIANHIKNADVASLFDWVGECIATVVAEGTREWNLSVDRDIPLGITFSFPMIQHSLSEAALMAMGKGFIVEGNPELSPLVLDGYRKARGALPPIKIVAIANDSVSTLVSFIYAHGETPTRKACMGLIVGTGCNATVPLELRLLHKSKRPQVVSLLPGESLDQLRIAVNTEWSINGSAPPLRDLGLITRWDDILDRAGEIPGFQPLEYMTSGRYLGELGRLMLIDYLENILGLPPTSFPPAITQRHGISTTFLSHLRPLDPGLLASLEAELPPTPGIPFAWTSEIAAALCHITKAIQVRAAGIVSAGIVALLKLAGDFPSGPPTPGANGVHPIRELGVGYTGGCIAHFQDYLEDTERFLAELVRINLGPDAPFKIILTPCHDGGIKGAGILAAAAEESQDTQV
ncbi:hexokinase-7 [Plectosphaerella plurivora]|uniref:Phosphotransferase n=1 Tax=Plectosphaerella plurivora TaxID=936078 RepID=A0A9P8V1Z1_9PEZI|nr:hexokinase-7 [Plectosphaerella plurivora]